MGVEDIEHWVVLVLENRSFDHLFGYLEMPHLDNLLGGVHACDGPQGGEAYVFPSTGVATDYITKPDPGHGFVEVCDQVYGFGHRPPAPATMRGFVQSYARRKRAVRPLDVMRCFRPQDLPSLSNLALNFAVCDRWFCSVPSSTWPNRDFFHAATSMGWADLDNEACLARMLGIRSFNAPTLFGRLAEARRSWRVYYHNPPHVGTMSELGWSLGEEQDHTYWREFQPGNGAAGFVEDVARGDLPLYTFIEPQFDPVWPDNPMIPDNSGHPSGDLRRAEALVRDIYNAMRASALWQRCALLVLFDEHGGFYDHVPPPSVPAELTYPARDSFRFDRLGPRVPALVISPWVGRGVVDHGPGTHDAPDPAIFYDHTSVAATLLHRIGGRPLTGRDAAAQRLDHLFDGPCRTACLPRL